MRGRMAGMSDNQPKLELPLWFVTERTIELIRADVCGSFAFTNLDDVMKFMLKRSPARWDVVQVTDREALIVVIADVHLSGASFVCLNCEPDGSGGDKVFLTDLIAV